MNNKLESWKHCGGIDFNCRRERLLAEHADLSATKPCYRCSSAVTVPWQPSDDDSDIVSFSCTRFTVVLGAAMQRFDVASTRDVAERVTIG